MLRRNLNPNEALKTFPKRNILFEGTHLVAISEKLFAQKQQGTRVECLNCINWKPQNAAREGRKLRVARKHNPGLGRAPQRFLAICQLETKLEKDSEEKAHTRRIPFEFRLEKECFKVKSKGKTRETFSISFHHRWGFGRKMLRISGYIWILIFAFWPHSYSCSPVWLPSLGLQNEGTQKAALYCFPWILMIMRYCRHFFWVYQSGASEASLALGEGNVHGKCTALIIGFGGNVA